MQNYKYFRKQKKKIPFSTSFFSQKVAFLIGTYRSAIKTFFHNYHFFCNFAFWI